MTFLASTGTAGVIEINGTVIGTILLAVWKAFDVIFIGFIQAFIFMLLTVIYFGMAREGLEHRQHTGTQH